MTDKYILDGKTPVPCEDLLAWGAWFQTADRQVARDYVGDKRVSTIFLGLDHGLGGKPMLFETMIFDESGEETYCERYGTWEEAEAGHAIAKATLEGETI